MWRTMIKLMRHKIYLSLIRCCDVIYVQDARKEITAEFLCFAIVQRFIVTRSVSLCRLAWKIMLLTMLSKGKNIYECKCKRSFVKKGQLVIKPERSITVVKSIIFSDRKKRVSKKIKHKVKVLCWKKVL